METIRNSQSKKPSFENFASGTGISFHVTVDNVERAFNTGSGKEIDDALSQLIQLCQCKELPQSDTQKAKSLLLAFLENMLPAEVLISSSDGVHEIDQLIASAFKTVLFLECEQFASSQQKNDVYAPACITQNQELHRLAAIFRYLNDKVAHLDDQLFDEACVLISQKKVVAAQSVFHILSDSKIKGEAADILFDLSINIVNIFDALPQNEFRPKCAVLYVTSRYQHHPSHLILALTKLAFENSNEFALLTLKELASKSDDPEVLEFLSEIYGDGKFRTKSAFLFDDTSALVKLRKLHTEGRFTELKNKDLAVRLKAKARECKELRSVRCQHLMRFNIPSEVSIESRLKIGKDHLSVMAGRGVEILLSLTKLSHPAAQEANEILTTWLGKIENRVVLIQEYGTLVLSISRELLSNDWFKFDQALNQIEQEDYVKKFKHHLTVLVQQVQTFNEQGNKEAAKQLVHQLLETEIQLELIAPHKLNSTFYQFLMASPAIDDTCQKEVQRRLEIIQGQRTASSLRDCVDFNAPKRPLANYQLGLILKQDTSGLLLKMKEAKDHFQRALDGGVIAAKGELEKLEKTTSSFNWLDIVIEANNFIEKHKAGWFIYKGQSDLKHALACYKWAADEAPSQFGFKVPEKYLEYLPEINDTDPKTLLEVGKEVLDEFDLDEHRVQMYIAVLDKATESIDVEVAAEAHLVLAKVYAEGASKLIRSALVTREKLVAEKVDNAAKHYHHAVELGNKEAVGEEVFFLAEQILTSSAHSLNQHSTFILRLKEIVDKRNKGAGKESVRQASLALATHYSTCTEGSFSSLIGLLDPVAEGKKYDDIARRLSYEIEIEQTEKAWSFNLVNKPFLLKEKSENQLRLAAIKHSLAEMHLNAIGGEHDMLKAAELFIAAADLEHQAMEVADWEHQASMAHQASREALVNLANELMKLNSSTTPQLEALYRLSQVMDTLLIDTEISYTPSEVLLEQAAKMGHPEAKAISALKEERNKAIKENDRQVMSELQREEYKNVGGSSKRNPDFYDK